MTSAVLQPTYPGALETTVPSSSEPPTEAPPVLSGSAVREAGCIDESVLRILPLFSLQRRSTITFVRIVHVAYFAYGE